MEALLTDIPVKEVLRYLGHEGQVIESGLQLQIEKCINSVRNSSKPRLTYTIRDVKDGIINGLDLGGNNIKLLLSSCNQAIIMAATLGPEAEQLLRRSEVMNMSNAVIMDVLSAKREAVAEAVREHNDRFLALKEENTVLRRKLSELVANGFSSELEKKPADSTRPEIFFSDVSLKLNV